ncbi:MULTISPECIES: hypothetical protein [Xanthomonas]|uniref:Uncharacterized protein n=1 Tax=Xanthomonas hortorum pv. gardneri TaxID=2754056 RepID=A0A6V7FJZ4_9XANT|nr:MULTISPECIES: hypothetical protein [Xanthomonas]APO97873.1 hypothetical protein BJD13_01425 [Xanthomonas perforans]APP82775.1 hypothetical protein BJD10_24140 [Xanthomonas hortorum pv. gardneri]KLA99318.1 hypothetical protein SM19410_06890 [Xanthomonas hortorum pv. gardneri]KLB02819.1 hypothetical protein SM17710_02675 [Xanthomonas hortorum pv. gardneri]KLB06095.1 hypothetical protein SM18210_02030 [Xanthomonas hortorum pv. gardneri]
MTTGLSGKLGKLAALDKNSQPDKPARSAKSAEPTTQPAPKVGTAKSAPKVGANRTITIRHLTDEDLRRISEFRYTHNMTIQDVTIKGISMFLTSMGLAPLSALADTPESSGDE